MVGSQPYFAVPLQLYTAIVQVLLWNENMHWKWAGFTLWLSLSYFWDLAYRFPLWLSVCFPRLFSLDSPCRFVLPWYRLDVIWLSGFPLQYPEWVGLSTILYKLYAPESSMYSTDLTHMPYCILHIPGLVAGSGVTWAASVATRMLQPRTAQINQYTFLEDIPI